LQLVEHVPVHIEAQPAEQLPQPEEAAESLQFVLHSDEQPELHAEAPHPFFEEPTQLSLHVPPQPARADPMQLSPQPFGEFGSSDPHEVRMPGTNTTAPNIGNSRLMNFLLSIVVY